MKFGTIQTKPGDALRSLYLVVLLLGLHACQPAGSVLPDEGTKPEAQLDATSAATPEKTADFAVRFRMNSSAAAFALQAPASMIEFSVKTCASGYLLAGLSAAQDSFQLYRYDQSCKVFIDRFTLDGQTFTPMPGQPFDPNVQADNTFIGDAGRILTVRVLQQLPHILDTLNANVSFSILEKSLGRNLTVQVHEVELSSSQTVLVESATVTVPLTIRRGLPASGSLTVGLEVSGTATPLVDLTAIPSEVEFQDGIAELTVYLRALPDDPYDDLETLQISIKRGPYFIAGTSLSFTVRDQSYRPPAWTQTVTAFTLQDDEALALSSAASDPDGDPIYYAIDSARTTCGPGWSPAPSISAAGLLQGIPRDAAVGSCVLSVTATSLGGMVARDITITVLDRAESPVWTQLPATVRLFEGESLDVTFRAVDPDPGASVSYSIETSSSCFGFAWNPVPTLGSGTGRLQGKPATAAAGRCIFTVRATSQGTTISTDFQVEIARRSLVWTAASGIPTSTCLPVSLRLSDGLDQWIEAPATATLGLAVNNGSGTYYAGSTCASNTAISVISFPVGATEINFYFRSTTANQNLTLVATGGNYEPGYWNISVSAAASKLLVSGPSKKVVNQCVKYRVDQASSTNVKVISATNRTVTLTLPSSMRAYNDAICSEQITSTIIPAYSTGSDFYVVGTTVGSRNIRATATSLTAGQLTVQVVASRSWWNSAWTRRLPIEIDNTDQAVAFTNQPVLIKLTPERFSYAEANADGSDLRFINSADTTVLPHQIEQWVPNGTSLIWVRVDQIPASSSSSALQLYFGNAGATAAEQPTTLWADYAGIWHLSESPVAAAPQFKDSTTQARHGRAMASPQSQQSPIGHGLGFMGSMDHIELTGFDLAPLLGRTATFSAWVKTAQVGGTIGWSSPAVTGVEHNGTTNDIQYGWLDNTGRIGVTAGDSGAVKSTNTVNDNTWRHITITRNEANGAVAFFVNGIQNGTGTSESGFKSTAFNRFGVLWDTSGAHKELNGYMDEIRISTSIMSADRIRSDYKYMVDTHVNYLPVEDY